MTVGELKQATSLLGFEPMLEGVDETAPQGFWHAVTRAIWTVERLRPGTALYRLYHHPMRSLISPSDYVHRGGVSLKISASRARSYSFFVSGTGRCTVSDGRGERRIEWSAVPAGGKRFCGFLYGEETSLCFDGEYAYPITSLCMWDDISSGNVDDIPTDPEAEHYDMAGICPDFLVFDPCPFFRDGDEGICRIENRRRLVIPRDKAGVYTVRYRRSFPRMNEEPEECYVLPIDEDICQIMPMLIASYLCLDTAPEKSSFYYKMFCEQFGLFASGKAEYGYSTVRSANGW